jgi:outer membrane protein OmpA-like peptidoglycan-associated protein
MPFNSNNYSVAHPALSADESTLYFASDMPGTLGQSDLYKIAINLDGSFGAPTNLGNKINTEGRETFPMVTSDGELYFASDGHPGLGGLDIFVSKMDKDGHFGEVVNVGEPVNSSYDDFAFLINDKTRYGYFTSNRLGGKGGDDIYKLKETQKLITKCEQNLSGLVTDKETGLPLADAKVTLLDADFKTLKEVMSDKDGKFDFGLKGCKTVFYIKVEKQEFAPTQTKAITIKEDESSYVEIPLEKPAQIIKKGDDLMKKFNITLIHFDLGKYNIRPDAEIELAKILDVLEQYPQMEIDIRSHTDSRQSAEKNRILSQNRASSTMEWLIKKGITQNRLTAKGYGESQLLNKCADGVKCSEEEHQANRRSEFIVTKI